MRTQSGEVSAFYNTCRHRGTRLLDGCGSVARIVCPYHSWVYSTEGSLVRAPGMDSALEFDPSGFGLLPVRLETWAGFIFINYVDDAPSLMDRLGNMPEFFSAHRPEELVCVRRRQFDVNCNWKLLIENALEAYHTGTVHRSTLGRQQSTVTTTRGEWSCLFVHVDGKDTLSVLPNSTPSLPRIQGLAGDGKWGSYFTNIYPCTQFVFAPDCMWWLAIEPKGPAECSLVLGSCFPDSTVRRHGFSESVKAYYERWDSATPEDNAVCETQQAGQAIGARPPGRFSSEEVLIHDLDNWVLDRLLDTESGDGNDA